MVDAEFHTIAKILVEHSFGDIDFKRAFEKDGKFLYITSKEPAIPLAEIVAELVWKQGGHVVMETRHEGFERAMLSTASEQVLKHPPSAYTLGMYDQMAAWLALGGDTNPNNLATIDSERTRWVGEAQKELLHRRLERKGDSLKLPWCISIVPAVGQAHNFGTSLQEYTDYLYSVMLLDQPDPLQAWNDMKQAQLKLHNQVLKGAKHLRFVSDDGTNLEMSIEGHIWQPCYGQQNFPDGEIYNAPVKYSVNGTFTIPTLPQRHSSGKEVYNVRIVFEKGKVKEYSAERGQDFLDEFFKTKGADYLGEVALGFNYNSCGGTGNVLLDEKMRGAFHIAFGQAIAVFNCPDDDSKANKSAVHWDLIKPMMDNNGRIIVDNKYVLTWGEQEKTWNVAEHRGT